MTSQIFYIYGFSLLLLSNVYAVYWNETEFLNDVDRRDLRRIRNKLVSFDTTDTDVEVAFQFNVPFVAVPDRRSMDNIKSSVASLVNLNVGSIALAGVMIVFGSLGSLLWSLFLSKFTKTKSNNNEDTNTVNATSTTDSVDATGDEDGEDNIASNEEKRKSDRGTAFGNKKFYDLIDLLDSAVNPTGCVQQYICSLRKMSAKNVANGRAASSDKIIAGIFEARWILDMISGTAIHDAIQFGESSNDCGKRFSKCGVESMRPEELLTMFLKILRVFKH